MPEPIVSFETRTRPRLIVGDGAIRQLGQVACEEGGGHVLIVTDRGIVEAGHVQHVLDVLREASLHVTVYDQVHENPTTLDVEHCVRAAAEANVDLIVGLGGGSSLDTAKGCNLLLTNGGSMQDYRGYGKAHQPTLPLIAVPTTAGTGSECQSYAVIAEADTHMKMACGDPGLAARAAILDPALTLTQPRQVTAITGIDAVSHALESAVSTTANPYSRMLSCEAWHLTSANLQRVLDVPDDLHARAAMQLGAAFAGSAIEHSMLGGAHAAANPLTARFGLAHGLAVGVMLPAVMRFNAHDPAACAMYAKLAQLAGLTGADDADAAAAMALIDAVDGLVRIVGVREAVAVCGIDLSQVPDLALAAAEQWTVQFNPRSLTSDDLAQLYLQAFADLEKPVQART